MSDFFKVLGHEIRVNFMLAKSYRFSFVLDILIFFGLVSFVMISDSGYMLSVYYSKAGAQSNPKELLLIAYAMWIISTSLISTLTNEIRLENMRGTLEYKFMGIVPYEFLMIAQVINSLLVQIVETVVIVVLARFLFHITLRINLIIVLLALMTMIGMYGFSLTMGALLINKKKIGQLTLIIQVVLLFASNVFTVSKLGMLSKLIPLGIGNHVMRLNYVGLPIGKELWIQFTVCCVLWLLVGEILFKLSVKNVKERGQLGIY